MIVLVPQVVPTYGYLAETLSASIFIDNPVPTLSFCRISEFGSIIKREFVTPIVAKRQDVMSKSGVVRYGFF